MYKWPPCREHRCRRQPEHRRYEKRTVGRQIKQRAYDAGGARSCAHEIPGVNARRRFPIDHQRQADGVGREQKRNHQRQIDHQQLSALPEAPGKLQRIEIEPLREQKARNAGQ